MIIGVIWILIGVILLGLYNGYLLLDNYTAEEDPKNISIKNKWHIIGSIIFLYISSTVWYLWGWKYIPFSLSCFWSIYAGIVHKIGLNRSFFFVGTTAGTDKIIRKISSKKPELVSSILKISLLILSVILLFIFK